MIDIINKLMGRAGFTDKIHEMQGSLSYESIKKYFQNHTLNELLPYESYDPATQFFHNRSNTGFVIEFPPLVGSTTEVEKELSGIFQHTLPKGSSIQFLMWADPKIGSFLQKWQAARRSTAVFAKLAENRVNFIQNSIKDDIRTKQAQRMFRCIVSVSFNKRPINAVERQECQNIKDQIVTVIRGLNLEVRLWTADNLVQFLNDILCFNQSVMPSINLWNPYDLIADQVGTSATILQVNKDSLLFEEGKSKAKSFYVTRFPSMWSQGAMTELIGDVFRDLAVVSCPFLIHYGVHIMDDVNAKTKLLAKAGYAEKQANSIIGKYIPSLRREAEEYSIIRTNLEQGDRLLKTSFNITLFSPSESLPIAEQTLGNIFRKSGWEITPDRYTHLQTLLGSLPLMWGEDIVRELGFFSKAKTTLSCEATNLLPIQGEWLGTQTPGLLLTGRRGQIFNWYPFDNNAGNYNVCVVGRSGAGKSVFMQELMSSILGLKGRVFVLDVGRSFEKSCHLLAGEFLEFSAHKNLCLNPFTSLQHLDEEGVTDSLTMLQSVLSVMSSPVTGTTDIENALLIQAIHQAWENRKYKSTISDVADILSQENDSRAKDLSLRLFPYTKHGVYGRFFEGEANVSFKNVLTIIELEELKERKDLQAVIVQMVILNITNQMFLGDRKTPFGIVFDEAWDMLRGKQSGVFIETLARRLRKYNGSLIVGTQSINDFYASEGAQAAFDNSDWMCLLSQKQESIEQLKKTSRISMNPHMESLLSSVRTKQGEYAEVMIYGPQGYAIGRLILDPFSNILYSTQPQEYAAVKTLTNQGVEIAKAIEIVAFGTPSEESILDGRLKLKESA